LISSIYRFVGVDDTFIPDVLNERANAGVYSMPRLRLRRLMNPIRFTYHHGGQRLERRKSIGRIGRVTVRTIRTFDHVVMKRLFPNKRPVLNPEVQQALATYYRADASALRDEFNLDVDHWTVFSS